jgi:hypothetical protein
VRFPAEHKFHAKRTYVDSIAFDSKKEAARYQELRLAEKAGVIANLELQPRYPLIVNNVALGSYVGDFLYEENGERVVEDVKGMKTPVYRLKKKLLKAIYGIDIRET